MTIFQILRRLPASRTYTTLKATIIKTPSPWIAAEHLTLNVDGSYIGPHMKNTTLPHRMGCATCGGIIRDGEGNFVGAFSTNLGKIHSHGTDISEAKAVKIGLELAEGIVCTGLQVQTDSKNIASLTSRLIPKTRHSCSRIIQACRKILRVRHWNIVDIHRDGNLIANKLAHMGHKVEEGTTTTYQSLSSITDEEDRSEIEYLLHRDQISMRGGEGEEGEEGEGAFDTCG
ncbi:hypothetical protein FNV43_RR05038 [Rhamnella rubrinervis]|uniref:RNase H type-1 domain-containing protein n=1 Tax=Rhamnella rubrinervis TaxID=2594499 RepID=A0A8K0HMY8_9ROSA|nr:hypothetical protein FNV43_RR05038 [Rhamnella rubrinervis]